MTETYILPHTWINVAKFQETYLFFDFLIRITYITRFRFIIICHSDMIRWVVDIETYNYMCRSCKYCELMGLDGKTKK